MSVRPLSHELMPWICVWLWHLLEMLYRTCRQTTSTHSSRPPFRHSPCSAQQPPQGISRAPLHKGAASATAKHPMRHRTFCLANKESHMQACLRMHPDHALERKLWCCAPVAWVASASPCPCAERDSERPPEGGPLHAACMGTVRGGLRWRQRTGQLTGTLWRLWQSPCCTCCLLRPRMTRGW